MQIITPDNGKTAYTYDRGGLLQKIWIENVHALNTDIITNTEYDAKGQRQKVQYKNGTTTTYQYDEFTFRVRQIRTTRHSDNKTLQDLQYWYDPIGNITLQKDLAQQPVYFDGTVADSHNDYTYDALYRLIQAEGREHAGNNAAPTYNDSSRIGITPIPIASTDTAKMRRYIQYYEYDEVGNFTQMRHTVTGGIGNWTRYYTTDTVSNKLLETVIGSGTPESYQYDSRGNITDGFGHLQRMTYNDANRLERVEIDGNRTAYYQYDAAGQRVRKTIINTTANKTEVRKYVGNWETYRRFVTSSLTVEIQRETLHISDDMGRMALIDTRTAGTGVEPAQLLRYQYSNHLSTATLELDETARIISYEEYYPYGSTSFQSGRSVAEVALKRYRNTGKERDEESGLYYYGARYYIPWLARWTAVDPLAELYIGISPYAFTANNPIRFREVDGRYFEEGSKSAKQANKIEKRAEKKANKLEKQANKLERKGKSSGDLIERVAELRQSAQDVRNMRNDQSTEYKYAKLDGKESKALELVGPSTILTGQNDKGDNIVTMFTEKNMGNQIHETRHGGQNTRGEFNIATGAGYGVADEISAYRAQYSWDGKLQYRDQPSEPVMVQRMKGGQNPTIGIITNINQINGTVVNSMLDPGFIPIYPPPTIPLNIWNNN